MNKPANATLDRRGFLKATGAALAFLTVLETAPERAGAAAVAEPAAATPLAAAPVAAAHGGPEPDPLIRMQEDLKRALQKPVKDRRWVMVLDLRKCVGCHACTISCVAENKL